MWSSGEGNGKPLQYSCLENTLINMKRQKDRTLKDELPRSAGAQHATGEKRRNNCRKKEETGQGKNNRMISVCFRGKPFNIMVIQVYVPTSNTEEAEVEWFHEDLQDLLELTPKKDVLFIIGAWNAKVGSQETPE